MPDNLEFNILIVDDERSELDVLTHILEQDYNISIAKSGQAALKIVAKDKPDLILLDVVMPDMSGFDVLSELKNDDATRSIPVIFITGLDQAKDEEKGLSLGAVDYITKPFHYSIVRARINTHLQIVNQIRTIQRKDATLNILESVLDGMDIYLYVTDPETDEILFVNKALMEHFNLTGSVLGQPCWKIFQSNVNERCKFCSLHGFPIGSREPVIWEAYNTVTGGYYRNIDRIINWSGGKAVHFCQRIDISEMKKAEIEKETALQKAEQASRAKSEFLSRMSHEMRTPMNAIIGMTGIAKDSTDSEKRDDCLDKIDRASKHLLSTISDILDMSQIESGELTLSYNEFNFEKMITETVDNIKFQLDEKNHNITVNLNKDIPPVIISDERRLSQITANLLLNAIKFTPEGGNITLSVKVADNTDNIYTILTEVSDNGIGISEDAQAHLFEAFKQADGGVARKYDGLGLGLAISKNIVERMGGNIWVESEPGHGSTFRFTIAAQKADAAPCSPPAGGIGSPGGGAHRFAGKTVLIAEDVEINRMIVEEMLADTGVIVECVENGREALEAVKASPDKYALILMDINMPEMDGYTATRLIRAHSHPVAAYIPIVAMTANVFKEDVEKCLEVGMNDHIGKPLDMNVLLEKLTIYLSGKERELI